MRSSLPLMVVSVCTACCFGVLLASADAVEDARQAVMEKELNCLSSHVKQGVSWDDVCYTSEGTDKDRLVTKSMDQMIEENNAAAQDLSKDSDGQPQTLDSMAQKNSAYANSEKSVDDVIKEQGVDNQVENAESAPTPSNSQDSSQAEQPQYAQYAQNNPNSGQNNYNNASGSVDFTPQGSLAPSEKSVNDRTENQNRSEIGFEYDRQRYVEPIFDLVDKGSLFGGYVNYTFRPSKSENLYEDIIDMYKAELRGDYGLMDYSSAGSGKLDGNHDWVFEARLLAGKDFAVTTDSRLTPYLGFGFRYLNDDSSGRATSTGALGYERESRYFYIPVGVEWTTHLTDGWLFVPDLEYDVFTSGTQVSHLSDVDAGAPDIKNKQRHGFGMRGSLKFIKECNPVNFVFEPYIRYWHIQDSDETTAAGPVFLVTGLEPENKSTEYGVRAGVQF